jgi:hypothetical protein
MAQLDHKAQRDHKAQQVQQEQQVLQVVLELMEVQAHKVQLVHKDQQVAQVDKVHKVQRAHKVQRVHKAQRVQQVDKALKLFTINHLTKEMLFNLATRFVKMKLILVVDGEFKIKQHVVLIKEHFGIVMVIGYLLA